MHHLTYGDIYISPLEQEYIDSFDIDYWDAQIYPEHGPIVNHIIEYKDKLRDAIRPNSIATTIDAEPEDFPPAVKKFINSF